MFEQAYPAERFEKAHNIGISRKYILPDGMDENEFIVKCACNRPQGDKPTPRSPMDYVKTDIGPTETVVKGRC